jgi:phage shock protein PspC (stress-responsive transcriptional regulator)
MLGLPMPAWLAQFLMALTLALHWAFLTMTAGGAVAYVLPPRSDAGAAIRKGLSSFLPFSLTTAMTLGIAPLLFVQVLYGQFFYTANILMGYVWLGLLVLMIVNFYTLYYGWRRIRQGRSMRFIGIIVLVLMAASAKILSANATLTQSPDAWQALRAAGGLRPYLRDATFWPRWSMAVCFLLAGGGLFVAIFARVRSRAEEAAIRPEIRRTLTVSLVGFVSAAAAGLWGGAVLPAAQRGALLASAESVFTYAAVAALAGSLALVVRARRSASLRALLLPAATFFVTLLSLAFARDAARRAALADYFNLAAAPVHSQWGSFALFAGIFLAGLGVIAYVVYLAFAPPPAAEAKGHAA